MTTEEHIELARAAGRAPDAVTALQAAGATTQQVRRALGRALGISPRAVEAAIRASSMRTQSRTDALKVYLDSDFYCDEALSGVTAINIVRETNEVLAFHHTRPFWPVHIVVIPKQHIPSLTDLGDGSIETVHAVLEVVRELAQEVTTEHGSCRVLTNLGEYQDSKHLHFHVAFGEDYGENRSQTTMDTS